MRLSIGPWSTRISAMKRWSVLICLFLAFATAERKSFKSGSRRPAAHHQKLGLGIVHRHASDEVGNAPHFARRDPEIIQFCGLLLIIENDSLVSLFLYPAPLLPPRPAAFCVSAALSSSSFCIFPPWRTNFLRGRKLAEPMADHFLRHADLDEYLAVMDAETGIRPFPARSRKRATRS